MTELDFIEHFLRENAAYVRERYARRGEVTVTAKAHAGDLLTEVDLTVQKRAAEQVAAMFPGDHFVGEEEGAEQVPAGHAGRCWLIDPVDGTYNFVRGLFPVFAVSIAFVTEGLARAAGVLVPELDMLFLAERGAGATRNGRRLRVSGERRLEASGLILDVPGPAHRGLMLERGARVVNGVGQVRAYGSSVVAICSVATGDADAYLNFHINAWDFAAAQLILEEAGGRASRLDGKPLFPLDPVNGTLFSNGAVHEGLLELLN
jgi:myo-inositol-1(or 4)-monophosphatase